MKPERGRIFLRGKIYHVAYCVNGEEIRESAHTTDEKVALKYLAEALKKSERPNFVGPKEKKLTLDDLEAAILASYAKKENRSADTVKGCLKHVKQFFPFHRLIDISTEEIDRYQLARLAEGAARATVNREVAYLRHGFRLLLRSRAISEIPFITLLDGEYVRQGFIKSGDFERLLEHVEPKARDIIEFLYHCGWRSGEAKHLEWRDIDTDSWMARLRREHSKNKKPRLLPLRGRLREIIERRLKERRLDCPYVFHRNGKQIKSFLKTFKSAASDIGMPDLVPHDMRRSAIRNFRKAGLSTTEGKMLSGHKTDAVYYRYNIQDEEDLNESMDKVQEHLRREKEQRKVIPMVRSA